MKKICYYYKWFTGDLKAIYGPYCQYWSCNEYDGKTCCYKQKVKGIDKGVTVKRKGENMELRKVYLNDVLDDLWDVYNKYNNIYYKKGPKAKVNIQEIMNDLATVVGVLPGQRNSGQDRISFTYYL